MISYGPNKADTETNPIVMPERQELGPTPLGLVTTSGGADHSPWSEPPWLVPRTAYVHIPFCAHKCGYCDFASLAGADHLADRYLTALEMEMEMRLQSPAPVESIFVGGGTPTRLNPAQLDRLLGLIRHWFPLRAPTTPLAPGAAFPETDAPFLEFTVEANPGTLDDEKVAVLAAWGVNRVSLGAQSFHTSALQVLERQHQPDDVPRALALVAARIPRWSLDLIFGVPGTTLDDWKADLEIALALGPNHLSCYGLTFEKGTRLQAQRLRGEVAPIEEGLEYDMFDWTMSRLTDAGLPPYEISNYARPGFESRHNLSYWANDAYYGVGLGAARYVQGLRAVNTREMTAYLKRLESGADPTGPNEVLEPRARAGETAMLMLRRVRWGIHRADFRQRTGFDLDLLAPGVIMRYVSQGWLEDTGTSVRLTREGLFVADEVCAAFL